MVSANYEVNLSDNNSNDNNDNDNNNNNEYHALFLHNKNEQITEFENADQLELVQSACLSKVMGDIGCWQIIWCFLLSLYQSVSTFQMFMFVFQSASKTFWCARPIGLKNVSTSVWINLTRMDNGCQMPDIDYSLITDDKSLTDQLLNLSSNLQIVPLRKCNQFEFSTIDGSAKTLTEEFGLICERQNMLSVVEMCFLIGAAIGSLISGSLSDRFGRRHTLMVFATIQSICGILIGLSTSLIMYMTLRVIIGFASMTVVVISFVLVIELVSGKWQTVVGILNILPVTITYVLTASIAYFIRDWRSLQITICIPWLMLLTIWIFIPESPRWLLTHGQLNELYQLIEKIARFNKRTLPKNYKNYLEEVTKTTDSSCFKANDPNYRKRMRFKTNNLNCHPSPSKLLFSRKYLKTTILSFVVWLTLIIVYFGLTLHLSNFGGNIYLNTIIAGSIESLTVCFSIKIFLKTGLKRNLITCMLIPGLCCLATNFSIFYKSDNENYIVIILAIVAKCIIGISNAVVPTYTAMQYPTLIRNAGVGLGNLAAGVGLIMVPYLWLLENFNALLPMNVMGVCGLLSAIALYFMDNV